MKYNLDLRGFEGRELLVEGSGVFREARVFCSDMSAVEMYILTGILTAIAVIGYIVIASLVGLALIGIPGS